MKIAVLFGGCSTEYSVSLQSAHAVLSHLDEKTYEVIRIGITREGKWYRYSGALDRLLEDSWHEQEEELCQASYLRTEVIMVCWNGETEKCR